MFRFAAFGLALLLPSAALAQSIDGTEYKVLIDTDVNAPSNGFVIPDWDDAGSLFDGWVEAVFQRIIDDANPDDLSADLGFTAQFTSNAAIGVPETKFNDFYLGLSGTPTINLATCIVGALSESTVGCVPDQPGDANGSEFYDFSFGTPDSGAFGGGLPGFRINTPPPKDGSTPGGNDGLELSGRGEILKFTFLGINLDNLDGFGDSGEFGLCTHAQGFTPAGPDIDGDGNRTSSMICGSTVPGVRINREPDPVPAPLPLLGLGAMFAYARKLRKRIKATSSCPDHPYTNKS